MITSKVIEYPPELSSEAVAFLSYVLVRDPEKRPSVLDLMTHPWITKFTRKGRDMAARKLTRCSSAMLMLPNVVSDCLKMLQSTGLRNKCCWPSGIKSISLLPTVLDPSVPATTQKCH